MALALALAAGCGQRGDELPAPPLDRLHYPALMAAVGQGTSAPVLVVNSSDLDGAYRNGALLAVPTDPAAPFLGGLEVVPNASEVRVLQDAPAVLRNPDEPTASQCGLAAPTLFLAADDRIYRLGLDAGVPVCAAGGCAADLRTKFASSAWPLAISCPAGGPRRVWVGFLRGKGDQGYVGQLTLDGTGVDGQHHDLDDLVEVAVGMGFPQAFAYDVSWDRLYFVTQEYAEASYLRWIEPGAAGCQPFPDDDGVQDVTRGGCPVDAGVELSQWQRGAEGADVRLSSSLSPCETKAGEQCRRLYVAVRLYDADVARAADRRPSIDLGGELWVMEIPEGPTRPQPALLHRFSVGNGVARLQVIPRTALGLADLVAVVAREDAQLWVYDDQMGAMVFKVGRDQDGVPLLGHKLLGLAAVERSSTQARLFVSSDWDQWISAVDVDLAQPSASCVVHTRGADACTPGSASHPSADILRLQGNLQ